MRRVGLLLAIMAAALVVASWAALAVVRTGGPGDDYLRGTNGPDALSGKAVTTYCWASGATMPSTAEQAATSSVVAASAAP